MMTVLPHPASLISNPIRPLKRVEYEKLVAEGCFRDEKVELLFGMVVAMSPTDPAHGQSVRKLNAILNARLAGRALVSCQDPFAATDDSEPQPDVFVVPEGDYWHAHPDRAYLVIEVARSSLEHDRGPKQVLYGRSDVDEYWIINHTEDVVEVYRDRRDEGWQSLTTYGRGETLAMLAFPDVEIAVSDILPPIG